MAARRLAALAQGADRRKQHGGAGLVVDEARLEIAVGEAAARLEAGRRYAPDRSAELVIEGGNHAQFGSYGKQRGDGEAAIPPEEQWTQAADFIAAELDRAA